jgi:DNA-binding transcriptional MerR regulator
VRAPASFNISEAASRAGISADAIRYYERVGVLPKPPRTESGYRRYTDESIARMVFVRNAAAFGFPLKELAGFLRARDQGRPPCRSVKVAGERLLAEMDRQLAQLGEARRQMAVTLQDWDRRLAETPAGAPARLLESLGVSASPDRRRRGRPAPPSSCPSSRSPSPPRARRP